MSGKRSAGLLLFRGTAADLEVPIGHMGGPCRAAGDEGARSIPRGGYGPEEQPEAAARESGEELGPPAPQGERIAPGESRQGGGKTVTVRAFEGDLGPRSVVPGTFTMQWPPRSGAPTEFPEVDRAGWVPLERAAELLAPGQRIFLERLAHHIRGGR
ncbi:NUDIX domain-containing protein [Streptomyces pacificus]|uniref:NUDIX domain-containing protein n=1 Tax=Streptomyces pacificus TaxID=2705029 RepID=A0A6A0ANK4_9ACTN|nr:NUDIX domain-containing protein [Streptomyces pacificus]GFH34550.1 NUDIX domain-containing protein [Streptomyces pacificus]